MTWHYRADLSRKGARPTHSRPRQCNAWQPGRLASANHVGGGSSDTQAENASASASVRPVAGFALLSMRGSVRGMEPRGAGPAESPSPLWQVATMTARVAASSCVRVRLRAYWGRMIARPVAVKKFWASGPVLTDVGAIKLWRQETIKKWRQADPANLAKGAIRVRSLLDLAETLQNKGKRWSA
jgi:hypothetical protein